MSELTTDIQMGFLTDGGAFICIVDHGFECSNKIGIFILGGWYGISSY